ncbi:MAG: histidinol-phosphate transaminase [Burkholderiaceae bacterium]|jgi:histidinol-phosphate aminotransferase
MNIQTHVPAHIRAIAPYQAGKPIAELAREYGLEQSAIIKLASNENPLGMSPKALQALQSVGDGLGHGLGHELGRYPDANGFYLKAALARKYAVPTDWLTLGNGSNDILELAALAFLTPGVNALYSDHAFAVYALATQARGAGAVVVPARALGHDLPAMLAGIDGQVRLVFIANPNNPTGTLLGGAAIADFLAGVPEDVVVVLDEAYNEYLAPEQRYDAIEFVRRHPNLLLSRSFSKAYGLAGLRVGYGVAQPGLTELLNRVRQPFNVNTLAQAAAAAALFDDAFLRQTYDLNQTGLRLLEAGFRALQLEFVPSAGNFVLVKVGNTPDAGQRVFVELLRRGIIVRPVGNYGLPQWLRVSVGLPAENAAFLAALPLALQQARNPAVA